MPQLTTHLYIVRHAWAEDSGPGIDDHARRLTKKGRKRFAAMMKRLCKAGMQVDVIATSPLARAVETAELLAAAFDNAPKSINDEIIVFQNRFPVTNPKKKYSNILEHRLLNKI